MSTYLQFRFPNMTFQASDCTSPQELEQRTLHPMVKTPTLMETQAMCMQYLHD
jgi:hypothetical protein